MLNRWQNPQPSKTNKKTFFGINENFVVNSEFIKKKKENKIEEIINFHEAKRGT